MHDQWGVGAILEKAERDGGFLLLYIISGIIDRHLQLGESPLLLRQGSVLSYEDGQLNGCVQTPCTDTPELSEAASSGRDD
jgi:hypothetical protein